MGRIRLAARLAIVAILIPIGVLMMTATTASAAAYRPASSALICSTAPAQATSSATNYLPMNRWAGAVSTQHERQSGGGFLGINVGGSINGLERSIYIGFPTELSSSMWRLGGGAVTLANNFCFSTSVGAKANQLAATIGSAFTGAGAPILVGVIVIALLAAIWSASRGRAKWGSVIRVCVIVGIFAAMVGAAAASTPTNPKAGSPEWIITHTYTAVAKLATAPTAAITGALVGATGSAATTTPAAKTDALACSHYDSALITDYQNAYAGKLSDSVPMALNGLWMESVLPAYSEMALGGSNNYAALVSCRLLEDQSGIPASTQLNIERLSGETAKFPASKSSAAAWYTGADNSTTVDRSMIAWAACQSTAAAPLAPAEWTSLTGAKIQSAWTQVADPTQTNGGTKITQGDCALWWTATVTRTTTTTGANPTTGVTVVGSTTGTTAPAGAEFLPSHSPFNYGGTQGKVAGATGKMSTGKAASGVLNYILTLHGETNTVGIATALVLLLASLAIMVVFLVLAVALLIAKLSLLIAILLLPIMLILAAFPGSASSKLPGYLKHTLSLVIFATCAALLLSVIALVTALVAGLGVAIAGPGSVIAILWIAIAPIAAVFAIHHFFKKVLKAPSPFKPTSAMAYGAAAGGFAGAGMASLGDRAMGMGRRAARTARSRVGGRGGSSGGGSQGKRSSRSGAMAPDDTSSRKSTGTPKGAAAKAFKAANGGDPAKPGEQAKADAWNRTQTSAEERRLRESGIAPKTAAAAAVATVGAAAVPRSTFLRRAAGVVRGHPKQVQRGKVRRTLHYGAVGAAGALMLAAGPVGAVALAGIGVSQAVKRYGPSAQRRRHSMIETRQQEANARLVSYRTRNDAPSRSRTGARNQSKRGAGNTPNNTRRYTRTPRTQRSNTMDTSQSPAPAPEAAPEPKSPPADSSVLTTDPPPEAV